MDHTLAVWAVIGIWVIGVTGVVELILHWPHRPIG